MAGAAGYYDQLAKVYDTATEGRWHPNLIIKPLLQKLLRSSDVVLDVGVGTGQTSAAILHEQPSVDVYAIDVSQQMIDICSKKYPLIHTSCSDITEFWARNKHITFDLVISVGAFEFFENPQFFIECSHEMLRRGGHLIFTFEPLIHFHEIQSEAKSAVVPGEAASSEGVKPDSFYTFRHPLSVVLDWLSASDFKLMETAELVAYQKADSCIIYQVLCARKN